MEKTIPKTRTRGGATVRTGRPREFDVDQALDAAMRLFWEQGYEGTSLARLREVTGLSSASLYAAFSSKEGLFDAVVQRYNTTFGTVTDVVADTGLPPRAAVERMLRGSAAMQTDPSHPAGCLVVLSAATATPGHDRVRTLLSDRRTRIRLDLLSCVRRAVASGELREDTDASALSTVVESFLWGLSTQARDGVTHEALDAAVDGFLSVWDSQRSDGEDRGGPAA